eukprot:scaffold2049_cov108-Cylindrotheca_fusiformis.AAC.3
MECSKFSPRRVLKAIIIRALMIFQFSRSGKQHTAIGEWENLLVRTTSNLRGCDRIFSTIIPTKEHHTQGQRYRFT